MQSTSIARQQKVVSVIDRRRICSKSAAKPLLKVEMTTRPAPSILLGDRAVIRAHDDKSALPPLSIVFAHK